MATDPDSEQKDSEDNRLDSELVNRLDSDDDFTDDSGNGELEINYNIAL